MLAAALATLCQCPSVAVYNNNNNNNNNNNRFFISVRWVGVFVGVCLTYRCYDECWRIAVNVSETVISFDYFNIAEMKNGSQTYQNTVLLLTIDRQTNKQIVITSTHSAD